MRFRFEGPSLVVRTPAKLNLFLEVLGKRPDGFHELETVMVSVGRYDSIRFSPSATDQIVLTARGEGLGTHRSGEPSAHLPVDDGNLIHRAAALLRETTGYTGGVRIDLLKRIPLQAGLGGGSSDAAATLVALNQFWQLGLSSDQLHRLAAQLGSDVNFFVDSPRAAICRGRGEQVAPLRTHGPVWFVIIKPPGGLSTADMFQNCELEERPGDARTITDLLRCGAWSRMGKHLHNRLQAAASQQSNEVRLTLETLGRLQPSGGMMTGSGSSCFTMCRSRREALRLSRRLRSMRLGQTFVVSMRS